MQSIYYYVRDNNNKPVITICLATDGKNIARGISVCSAMDNMEKKEGRRRAYERAVEALTKKENNYATNVLNLLDKTGFFIGGLPPFKSMFKPSLTKFEAMLVAKASGRKVNG